MKPQQNIYSYIHNILRHTRSMQFKIWKAFQVRRLANTNWWLKSMLKQLVLQSFRKFLPNFSMLSALTSHFKNWMFKNETNRIRLLCNSNDEYNCIVPTLKEASIKKHVKIFFKYNVSYIYTDLIISSYYLFICQE